MCYQTSFRGRRKASEGNLRQSELLSWCISISAPALFRFLLPFQLQMIKWVNAASREQVTDSSRKSFANKTPSRSFELLRLRSCPGYSKERTGPLCVHEQDNNAESKLDSSLTEDVNVERLLLVRTTYNSSLCSTPPTSHTKYSQEMHRLLASRAKDVDSLHETRGGHVGWQRAVKQQI